ncbi:MAG: hypothetical protein DRJ66_05735 [Thermoprotei archaeon]|nr:MAG: hypothetical protein DRJ66_05735 [Thermoprotei archaeon]
MKEEVRRKAGMRNVITLGVVSFLNDVSTEMVRPMLPTFVINVLRGTTANWGLIEGVSEFLSYVLRIPSGILSDMLRKRKPLALLGYGISTITKPFLALSTKWTHVLLLKSVDRVGKGIRTAPRDAMIAESVKGEKAGRAFGIHRTLDQAGAVMGPFIAFMLFPMLGYRNLFIASFIPGLLALLVLSLLAVEVAPQKVIGRREIINIVRNKVLLLYVIISAVFACSLYSFSYVLIYANAILGIPDRYLNLVFIVLNIAHVIIGIPMGILADKIGIGNGLGITCLLLSLTSFFMIKNPLGGLSGALMTGVLYGLFQGGYEALSRAAIPVLVTSEAKGSAYALLSLAIATGTAIANILMGFLWQRYGYNIALYYSLSLSTICAIIMPLIVKRPKG